MPHSQIGVFDSGIGGLTVLKELARAFPGENFLYFGDTARLPYGTKSPETIRAYSEQIMNRLAQKRVKAIVIACNTASSQVPENNWQGIPVYNVIGPGAYAAARSTARKSIGVLGTRATIESGVYVQAIHAFAPDAKVFTQACPMFVPLAEEGWIDDPVTDAVVARYLGLLLKNSVDTVVLGCTHYPLLKEAIRKFAGPSVALIDSGIAIAEFLEKDMNGKRILRNPSSKRAIQIEMSDLSPHTEARIRSILSGHEIASIQRHDLV
ncbi:MAG TPA: glutamate racemase [Bdellovibrionales bacterium]|nr:glutamate racemase [Bdellovibrionales bacterium]